MRDVRRSIRDGWIHPICRGAGCSFVRETERRFGLASYQLSCGLETIIRPAENPHHLLSGWAWPEAWGAWSDGPLARLGLRPSRATASDLMLCLRACAFLPRAIDRLQVGVQVNGRRLGSWVFGTADGRTFPGDSSACGGQIERRVAIPRELIENDGGDLVVEFEIDRPRSPLSHGRGKDDRNLGMGLMAFWLVPVERQRRIARWARRYFPPRGCQYAQE